MMTDDQAIETTADNRLSDLHVSGKEARVGKKYSRFVKLMRLGLPVLALVLTVIVIFWPDETSKIAIIQKTELIPEDKNMIGQNELLNPRFETTDAQAQPVNVTAIRALQNQDDPDLIKLDKPNADLKMKDGSDIHLEALSGTYEQNSEKLYLRDEVKIRHESGYELQAEELRVDMKTREAFSDKNVLIDGPDAKIEAIGLEGNMADGILTFKGPAKMTIYNQKALSEGNASE